MNVWSSGKVFFDVKAVSDFQFDSELYYSNVGLAPSLRFRANKNWDISADLGIVGFQYYDYEWSPTIMGRMSGVSLNAVYRF